ncbi:hypothetical protein LINPERPRIM_LOCUS1789 [Linum perenne]
MFQCFQSTGTNSVESSAIHNSGQGDSRNQETP